jgi:serine/threonine-protein kinase
VPQAAASVSAFVIPAASSAIIVPDNVMMAAPEPAASAAAPGASMPATAAGPANAAVAPPKLPAVVKEQKPAPKETPKKETAKEKRAREARERDARSAATTSAAAVQVPTGILRIAISPWGEVEVDGRRVGTSPPLTELNLPAGRHQIVVRNTDLPPYSTTVNVTADQPVTLKHKF